MRVMMTEDSNNSVSSSFLLGDDSRHVWESEADGAFAILEDEQNEPPGCGTEIRLHLRDDALEYLDEYKLKCDACNFFLQKIIPLWLGYAGLVSREPREVWYLSSKRN